MICKLCGRESAEGALYCEGCGNSFGQEQVSSEQPQAEQTAQEPAAEQVQPEQITWEQSMPEQAQTDPMEAAPTVPFFPVKIKSHMVMAIVTTVIFFNWILGIPAIVFARECELAAERGQPEIAARFSRRAITFALVGVVLNIAIAAFIALVAVVMLAAGPAIFY